MLWTALISKFQCSIHFEPSQAISKEQMILNIACGHRSAKIWMWNICCERKQKDSCCCWCFSALLLSYNINKIFDSATMRNRSIELVRSHALLSFLLNFAIYSHISHITFIYSKKEWIYLRYLVCVCILLFCALHSFFCAISYSMDEFGYMLPYLIYCFTKGKFFILLFSHTRI